MYLCIYILCVYICMYVCVSVFMYVSMYAHITLTWIIFLLPLDYLNKRWNVLIIKRHEIIHGQIVHKYVSLRLLMLRHRRCYFFYNIYVCLESVSVRFLFKPHRLVLVVFYRVDGKKGQRTEGQNLNKYSVIVPVLLRARNSHFSHKIVTV